MKTDEWNASPKKKKPLADKLNDLSNKIHKAERAVRNEKGEVIGMVPFEIYNTIRIQEVAAERERIKKLVKKRYYKLTLRHGGGDNDMSVDYYDDLGKLCSDIYHLGVEGAVIITDCIEVSEEEYNNNWLPI